MLYNHESAKPGDICFLVYILSGQDDVSSADLPALS